MRARDRERQRETKREIATEQEIDRERHLGSSVTVSQVTESLQPLHKSSHVSCLTNNNNNSASVVTVNWTLVCLLVSLTLSPGQSVTQ